LEGEGDAACQLAPPVGEDAGGAYEHGDVGVVPAGVHGVTDLRGEVQAGVLVHRQRVHVGSQQQRRTGVLALEHGDHRGRRRPRGDAEVPALRGR
jgi:hypothetical protein